MRKSKKYQSRVSKIATFVGKEEEQEEKNKMASVPPPPRAASTSDSGNSPNNQVEGAMNNGVVHGDEKKPDFGDGLDHLDSTQCIERFRQYELDYSNRLLAKYFSGKSLYGGNILYEQLSIGDNGIKSSRLTCFRSYADPVVGYEDRCSNGSSPPADTQANIPNGKHMGKN